MIAYKNIWGIVLLGIMILLLPQSCNNLEEKNTTEGPDLNRPKKNATPKQWQEPNPPAYDQRMKIV